MRPAPALITTVASIALVGFSTAAVAIEDWTDERIGPCEPRDPAVRHPPPGMKYVCYCGGTGPSHLRAENCKAVPLCASKPFEGDPELQKQLRCFQQGAPTVTKEVGAWLRADPSTCKPVLTDITEGAADKPKVRMHCPLGDKSVLANVHVHPFQSVDGVTGKVVGIDPRPSRGSGESDETAARECGHPVYVLSDHAIWRIDERGNVEDRTAAFPGWDRMTVDCKP